MKAFLVYLGMVAFTLAIFLFAPRVDLATSGLFYDPERGFVLTSSPPILLLFHAIPWIAGGTIILGAVGASWLLLLGRPLWRLDRKALTFCRMSSMPACSPMARRRCSTGGSSIATVSRRRRYSDSID